MTTEQETDAVCQECGGPVKIEVAFERNNDVSVLFTCENCEMSGTLKNDNYHGVFN